MYFFSSHSSTVVRAPVGREVATGNHSPLVIHLLYLYQSLKISYCISPRISVRYYRKLKPVPQCHSNRGGHSGERYHTGTGTRVYIPRLCNGRRKTFWEGYRVYFGGSKSPSPTRSQILVHRTPCNDFHISPCSIGTSTL